MKKLDMSGGIAKPFLVVPTVYQQNQHHHTLAYLPVVLQGPGNDDFARNISRPLLLCQHLNPHLYKNRHPSSNKFSVHYSEISGVEDQ